MLVKKQNAQSKLQSVNRDNDVTRNDSVQCYYSRSLLDDLALFDDEDAVGVDDGGEAVRDDDRRLVLTHLPQTALNVPLCTSVQR